jgi:hypothetical protein
MVGRANGLYPARRPWAAGAWCLRATDRRRICDAPDGRGRATQGSGIAPPDQDATRGSVGRATRPADRAAGPTTPRRSGHPGADAGRSRRREGTRSSARATPLLDPTARRLPLPLLRSSGQRARCGAARRPCRAARGRQSDAGGQPVHGLRGVQLGQVDEGSGDRAIGLRVTVWVSSIDSIVLATRSTQKRSCTLPQPAPAERVGFDLGRGCAQVALCRLNPGAPPPRVPAAVPGRRADSGGSRTT